MNSIKTKSPVSKNQIDALISKLEAAKSVVVDGPVLANLIRVCFECALKRNELIDLRIEDVFENGVIKDLIRVGDKEYKITNSAKYVLQNHLNLLKRRHYKLYQFKPLFPSKKGYKYSERNLANHLKKYFENEPKEISLESIRQAGICNHYDENKKIMTNEDSLKDTSNFTRTKSLRHIKDILKGEIQPAGKKPDKFIDFLKVIELLSVNAQRDGVEIDKFEYERLKKNIINDIKLRANEKDALLGDLKSEVDKSKQNRSRKELKQRIQYKSVTDYVQKSTKRQKR